jgi:hypothetical protein
MDLAGAHGEIDSIEDRKTTGDPHMEVVDLEERSLGRHRDSLENVAPYSNYRRRRN